MLLCYNENESVLRKLIMKMKEMKLSFIPVFRKNVFIFIIAAQHYRSLVKTGQLGTPTPSTQDYGRDTDVQGCQSTIVRRDLKGEVLYCVAGKTKQLGTPHPSTQGYDRIQMFQECQTY